MPQTILGIDPGTKYMGIVVLQGATLRSYGVHTLRNGERPHDVIPQARGVVFNYIATYAPDVVAIEKPLPIATKRAAVLSVISQELHNRSRELGLVVREITPRDVRQAVVGNPKATKLQARSRPHPWVRGSPNTRAAGTEAVRPWTPTSRSVLAPRLRCAGSGCCCVAARGP
jgi:Holliday junction resolvasome RuvABC endonuclease subunit